MDSGCTGCYECAEILGKISKYSQEIENLTDQVVKNFLQYNTQNPKGSRRSELPQHPAHASGWRTVICTLIRSVPKLVN